MGKGAVVMSDFYCLQCGNRGIPLPRSKGHRREKFHRKKLYCPHCKTDVNHAEVKNYTEVLEFKENFNKGIYAVEAKESISFIEKERSLKNGISLL